MTVQVLADGNTESVVMVNGKHPGTSPVCSLVDILTDSGAPPAARREWEVASTAGASIGSKLLLFLVLKRLVS